MRDQYRQEMFGNQAAPNPYAATTGATGGLGAIPKKDSGFDWGNAAMAGLAGGILPGILGGFMGGGPDPMDYLSQIGSQVSPYLKPYSEAGQKELDPLSKIYGQLASDPGAMMSKIGEGYHQSPGFQFALNQALQGAGHAAATGGMAGSPQSQQQAMQIATQMGNQDYYNYLNKAMGMFGQGLQGMQGLAGLGLGAGTSLSQAIAQALSAQAQAAQEQQATKASQTGGILGGLASLASAFL